jgi:hypothetical protein
VTSPHPIWSSLRQHALRVRATFRHGLPARDVSRDGRQSLMATPTADATSDLVVTLNWAAGLRK